ncbi:uncharacterized protein LOC106674349 [Cimex lectularius]|uniref:Uncharacterized protein n=1 Tax=Cimex lectularius TaxID=79782 RepID=A0A8I6SF30_CIMLE|nr:uncharacterized protein LOC106674349 [Cimex lectularius]
MIGPIVNSFLWRWSLRTGCMIIAIVGMVVAALTLLASLVRLTLDGIQDDEYMNMGLVFFIFFSAYLVVDFTFHMLIYFAAKRNDERTMQVCCLYMAVRFIIDIVYVIIIFVYQDYNIVLIVIFATFSVVRAYFFIVVFSFLAQLLDEIEAASQVAPEIIEDEVESPDPTVNKGRPVVGITSDGTFTKESWPSHNKGILTPSRDPRKIGHKKSVTIILPSNYVEKPPKSRRKKSTRKLRRSPSRRSYSFSGWSDDDQNKA